MKRLFGSVFLCGATAYGMALAATEGDVSIRPAVVNSTFPVLTAPAPVAGDGFGTAVALNAAGTELLVTGSGTGYLFALTAGQWQLAATLPCNLDSARAALSADGGTALLAGRSGACLYQAVGGIWAASPTVVATFPAYYGGQLEVAISGDGTTALVGLGDYNVIYQGGALLYQAVGGVWPAYPVPIASFTPPSQSYEFGGTVALSADGDTAAIGDPYAIGRPGCIYGGTGATYLYTATGGMWAASPSVSARMTGDLHSSDICEYFGSAVALSADGNTALAGAAGLGPRYTGPSGVTPKKGTVFQAAGGAWVAAPAAVASLPIGGHVAALSADGSIALSGTELFQSVNGAWPAAPAPIASFSGNACNFGSSGALSADGLTAVLGAPVCDPAAAGSVFIFKGADVKLVANANPGSVQVQQPFAVQFTVINMSSISSAQAVVLTDTLPAGVHFVSGSAGCAANGVSVTCSLANLAPQTSWQPSITVVADSAVGDVTDVASVTANDYNVNADSAVNISVSVSEPPSGGGGGGFAWLCAAALGLLTAARQGAQERR